VGGATLDPGSSSAPAIPTAGASATPIAGESSSPAPSASPATTPFRCAEKRGKVVDYSYKSKVAGTTVRYRVYFPPCYASSKKRFPYVVLMHGSDKDQTEWTRLMKADRAIEAGISNGTLPPMILVLPGGGDLANTRIFTPGRSYESVVLNEIIPAVEKRFCTWGNRAGREIGGISRGGFWAFLMAFRHPEKFAAVGGHSPFFHPDNAPPAYNPLDLAETVVFAAGKQPRIWVDRGKQDYAEPGITPFVATLKARGIPGTYKLYPSGRHEVAYWASHVATYLAFYGKSWPKSYDALPACGS
jgi:enterochelin esterase-like enzyme